MFFTNTMYNDISSSLKACKNRPNVKFMDYANTAEASFQDAGGRWVNWAAFIRKMLNIFLCANQISSNVSKTTKIRLLLEILLYYLIKLCRHNKNVFFIQAVYALFIAQNIQPVSIILSFTKFDRIIELAIAAENDQASSPYLNFIISLNR